jgi:TPR repeat protein
MKLATLFLSSLLLSGISLVPAQAHVQSANTVKLACLDGRCDKDIKQLHYLARYGSLEAATLLSMIYATGDGRKADPKRALQMLNRAVNRRHPPALFLLSEWYRQGFVVEADPAKAAELLQSAVKAGYAPALYKTALPKLANSDPAIQREGLTLLQAASEKQLLDAVFLLARLQLSGEIAKQDISAAANLFKQLVRVGHQESRPYLQQSIALLAKQADSIEQVAELQKAYDIEVMVAELQEAYDIEVIQVIGRDFRTESMLSNMVHQLKRTGLYVHGSMFRIRGQQCNASTGCVSISPRAGDRDLNQMLTNSL